MPELPEVETVRRVVERRIVGRTVTRVEGQAVQMRRPLDPSLLHSQMSGHRFTAARRRGKFLLLDLAPRGTLMIHLGMSGRLLFVAQSQPLLPHTHLSVHLEEGHHVRLVDPRRFGLAHWLEPGEEETDPSLAALGMEPLDERLPDLLPPLFHSRRSPIKALLMDQRLVAGVGNIYACEALWRAGIRPTRRGCQTSVRRLRRLVCEVQAVLREAIQQGGTTIKDFAAPEGDFGYFAVSLAVYGNEGEPCPHCGGALRDCRLGNRATVWCPQCQR
jgi:formamidopyrimidine-DNA glycosylase